MIQDSYDWIPEARPYLSSGQDAYRSSKESVRESLVASGEWDPAWDEEAEPTGLVEPGEKKTLDWGDAWSGGLGDILGDFTPIVAGVKELAEAKELWHAANRVKGDEATPEDFALIQAYMEEASADKTVGYHIGSILRMLPAFGLELWAGIGAARLGAKGAAKLGIESIQAGLEKTIRERGMRSVARKYTSQAAAFEKAGDLAEANIKRRIAEGLTKDLIKDTPTKAIGEAVKLATASTLGSEAMTSVAGGVAGQGWGGRSQADAYRRAFQKSGMHMERDEAGNLSLAFAGTLESFWDSLPAGIANTFVEHVTERMGGTLMRMPLINRLEGFQSSIAVKFMGKHKMKPAEFIKFLDKFGWDGPIEEYMEERAGGWIRGITFKGEDEWYIGEDEDGYRFRTEHLFPDWKQHAGELAAFALTGRGASALHSYFSGETDPLAQARGARSLAEVETGVFRKVFEQKLMDHPDIGATGLDNLRSGYAGQEEYDRITEIIKDPKNKDLAIAATDAGIRGFRPEALTIPSTVDMEAADWAGQWGDPEGAPVEVVGPSTAYQRQLAEQFKDYVDIVFVQGGSKFEANAAGHWSANTEGGKGQRGVIYINAGLREDTADEGGLTLLKKVFHEATHDYQWLDDRHKKVALDALFEKDDSLVQSTRLDYFTPFILAAKAEDGKPFSPNFLALDQEERLEEVARYQKEVWDPKQRAKGEDPRKVEQDEMEAQLAENHAEVLEFLFLENGVEYIEKLKERNPRVVDHIRDWFVKKVNRFRSENKQIPIGEAARLERLSQQLTGLKSSSDSLEIAATFKDALGVLATPLGRKDYEQRATVGEERLATQQVAVEERGVEPPTEELREGEPVTGEERAAAAAGRVPTPEAPARRRRERPEQVVTPKEIEAAKPYSAKELEAINEIIAGGEPGAAEVDGVEISVTNNGIWTKRGDSASVFMPKEEFDVKYPDGGAQLQLFGEGADLKSKNVTELKKIAAAEPLNLPISSRFTVDGTPLGVTKTGTPKRRPLRKDELVEAIERRSEELEGLRSIEQDVTRESAPQIPPWGKRAREPRGRDRTVGPKRPLGVVPTEELERRGEELAGQRPQRSLASGLPGAQRGDLPISEALLPEEEPELVRTVPGVALPEKRLVPMREQLETMRGEYEMLGGREAPAGEGVTRVISGGQTGADRIGLEMAAELGLETGGTAPKGFRTSRGDDPSLADFGVTEHADRDWKPRTKVNVANSDGTLLLGDETSPGSKLTIRYAKEAGKPIIVNPTPEALAAWTKKNNVRTLNVAGNRTYTDTDNVRKLLEAVFTPAAAGPSLGRLQMKGPNIGKIKGGSKTLTTRSAQYTKGFYRGDGIYTMPDGTQVQVTKRATVRWDDPRVNDEYAKQEGFESLEDMKANAGFAQMRDWLQGKTPTKEMTIFRLEYDPFLEEEQAEREAMREADRAALSKEMEQLAGRKAQVKAELFSEIFPEGSDEEVLSGWHAIGLSQVGEGEPVLEHLGGPFATKEEAAEKMVGAGFTYGPGIGLAPVMAEHARGALGERDLSLYENAAMDAHEQSYEAYVTLREFEVDQRNRHRDAGEDWKDRLTPGEGGQEELYESLKKTVSDTIYGRNFNRFNQNIPQVDRYTGDVAEEPWGAGTAQAQRFQGLLGPFQSPFAAWVLGLNEIRYLQENYDQPVQQRTGRWGVSEREEETLPRRAAAIERGRLKSKLPKIERVDTLTPELLRENPDKVYLFGDNLVGRGKAGQAVIRDEPNAIGIPTKKAPSMAEGSFMVDGEYYENKAAIDAAFDRIPVDKTVVVPSAGLGTGLARLKKTAPKTFRYLQNRLRALAGKTEFSPEELGGMAGALKLELGAGKRIKNRQAVAANVARPGERLNEEGPVEAVLNRAVSRLDKLRQEVLSGETTSYKMAGRPGVEKATMRAVGRDIHIVKGTQLERMDAVPHRYGVHPLSPKADEAFEAEEISAEGMEEALEALRREFAAKPVVLMPQFARQEERDQTQAEWDVAEETAMLDGLFLQEEAEEGVRAIEDMGETSVPLAELQGPDVVSSAEPARDILPSDRIGKTRGWWPLPDGGLTTNPNDPRITSINVKGSFGPTALPGELGEIDPETGEPVRDLGDAEPAVNLRPASVIQLFNPFRDWDYVNNRAVDPYSTKPDITRVHPLSMRVLQRELKASADLANEERKRASVPVSQVIRDLVGDMTDGRQAALKKLSDERGENPAGAEELRLMRLGEEAPQPVEGMLRKTYIGDVLKAYGEQPVGQYIDPAEHENLFGEEHLRILSKGKRVLTLNDLWAGYQALEQAAKTRALIARRVFSPERIGAEFGVGSDLISKAQQEPWRYTYVVQGEGVREGNAPVGELISVFSEKGGLAMFDGKRAIPVDAELTASIRTVLGDHIAADMEHFDRLQNVATSSGIMRLTEDEAARLEELGYNLRPLDGAKDRHFMGPRWLSTVLYGSAGSNREYFLRNPQAVDTYLATLYADLSHQEMLETFGHDIFTLSQNERFLRAIQHLEAEDLAFANYVLGHFVTNLTADPSADPTVTARVDFVARTLFGNRDNSLGMGIEAHEIAIPAQEQRRRLRFFAHTGKGFRAGRPVSMGETRVDPALPGWKPGKAPAEQPSEADMQVGLYIPPQLSKTGIGRPLPHRESAPQMSPFARRVLKGEKFAEYTRWKRALEKGANRYLPLIEWERHLESEGIVIPRHMRIALRQEMKRGELSQTQSRIERKLFKPLQNIILNRGKGVILGGKKLGFGKSMSFDDADRIAMLKAVQEKHDALIGRQGKDRPPVVLAMPAGIRPEAALKEIESLERKYGKEHVDALEKAVMKISAETRKIWLRSGLVSAEVIAFLEKSYPHYVPYREEEMYEIQEWKEMYDPQVIRPGNVAEKMDTFVKSLGSDSLMGADRGSDMRQPMFRSMLGMTKEAEDSPLLMLMGQLNHALDKELDSKISHAVIDLIKLAEANGIYNIATIVPEEKQTYDRLVRRREEGEPPEQDPRNLVTPVINPDFADNPLVYVAAGEDGKRIVIEFHPRYAQIPLALKSVNMPKGSMVDALQFVNKFTTFIAAMITRWNPAFSIPNFVRDTGTASAHITSEYGPAVAAKMFLRPTLLSSIRTLYKANKAIADGTYDPEAPEFADNPDMVLFERYRAAGAPVTFLDLGKMRGLEEWFKEVHQYHNPSQVHQLQFWKGKAEQLTGWVENLNDAFENTTRFAYFRYGIESGLPSKLVEGEDMDDQELGFGAKNLTVNFEAKGTIGGSFNSLFMFANANVQSNVRLFNAIFARDKKGKRSFQPYAKGLVGSIVTLHAALAFMNAVLGGTDPDDDEEYWSKIPDYEKRSNLILLNWMGQDGKGLKVPLPYGYNFFAAIGNVLGELYAGTKTKDDAMPYMFETALQAFSPVGGGTDITDMVTPTVAKPFFEVRNNRDWKGSSIYKERYGDDTIPDSELAFDSVDEDVQAFTTWLNEAAGGNKMRSGEFLGLDLSINPATIEHLAQFLGGGIGKELFRAKRITEQALKGEEVAIADVPLIRRFGLAPTKYAAASLYRERRDKIVQVERMYKAGIDLSDEDRRLGSLSAIKRSAESSIKKLRQRRRLYERDSEEYKQLEERERSIQNAFNKRWNQVMRATVSS